MPELGVSWLTLSANLAFEGPFLELIYVYPVRSYSLENDEND
jgi:hypothetical protein